MIGIIGAMDCEVEILKSAMSDRHDEEHAGVKFAHGNIDGNEVIVAKCGIGKVNAAAAAQTMILVYHPKAIINSGIAGGLVPELKVGDIVIGSSAQEHDMNVKALGYIKGVIPGEQSIFNADEVLLAKAQRVFADVMVGKIVSGDLFVAGQKAKSKLATEFDAVCAEMEGAAIAHVCCKNDVPFIIFRIMSDTLSDEENYEFNEKAYSEVISHKTIQFLCSK